MHSKLLSLAGAAALSLRLGAGPALAAPADSDADAAHARQLRQRGIALQSDSPRNVDKANHEMLRPGPYDGPMFGEPGQPDRRDGVRPVSQDSSKAAQGSDQYWNDARREAPMPPRRHYQPEARDQRMKHVAPVRSGENGVPPVRPQRERTPLAPDQWKQTRGDDVPFSYHR